MQLDVDVKICGVTRQEDIAAVAAAGARYIGFNFFKRSPRYVDPQVAADLARAAPDGMCRVALVVNASDMDLDTLTQTVPLDMVQLHGSESPQRVAEVKARTGLPVMKAVGVAAAADLRAIDAYSSVADQLLVDTKPPKDADLPGGNGIAFDWGLIAGRHWPVPWMLAGGLTAQTVGTAVRVSGARQLDLSSAVESEPGVKDPERIAAFCEAARAALASQ
ncbi:MAG: phosphoribosylanthranilate isomerase [Pseudomonadota bacterium]